MNPVAAGGVVADARIALIDEIVGDMQRGRPYYDVVVRQLVALRKTFTDPPPYAGLVLACDLEECQKKLATAKTIIVDEMSVIRSLQHERSAAQAEADRLRVDAERWRAVIGSGRVRVLGSAGLHSDTDFYGNPHNGHAHIGLELWTKHDAGNEPRDAVEWLTKYADTAIHAAKTEQERGE